MYTTSTPEKAKARKGIIQLVMWCAIPTHPHDVFSILRSMREDELIMAATQLKGSAGRLAWVELGNRYGYFKFDISITTGNGKLEVEAVAVGTPAHDFPGFN